MGRSPKFKDKVDDGQVVDRHHPLCAFSLNINESEEFQKLEHCLTQGGQICHDKGCPTHLQ